MLNVKPCVAISSSRSSSAFHWVGLAGNQLADRTGYQSLDLVASMCLSGSCMQLSGTLCYEFLANRSAFDLHLYVTVTG